MKRISIPLILTLLLPFPRARALPLAQWDGPRLQQFSNFALSDPTTSTLSLGHCQNGAVAKVDPKNIYILHQDSTESTFENIAPSYGLNSQVKMVFSGDCHYLAIIGQSYLPVILDLRQKQMRSLKSLIVPPAQESTSVILTPQFVGPSLFVIVENRLSNSPSLLMKYNFETDTSNVVFAMEGLRNFWLAENSSDVYVATTTYDDRRTQEFVTVYKTNLNSQSALAKLFARSSKMSNSPLRFLSDRFAIFETRGENPTLEIYSLNGNKVRTLELVQSVKSIDATHFIYQRLSGAGENSLHVFDLNSMTDQTVGHDVDLGQQSVLSIGQDGLLFRLDSDLHRGLIYFNSGRGQSQLFFAPPGAETEFRAEKRIILSTDGFQYPAYLYQSSARPKAMIIFVHGGGCHTDYSYGPDKKYIDELPELLRDNFSVLAVNYRNSIFFDPNYRKQQLSPSECGKKDIEDIFAAQAYVEKQWPGTPLFLWGHSQGGYLVNLAATMYADQLHAKAVISGAGMWSYDTTTLPFSNADLAKNYDRTRMPINYVQNLKVPFLTFHGGNDRNVDKSHADLFLKAAKKLNKNVVSFLPPHQQHHLDLKSSDWPKWEDLLLEFLNSNLTP